MFNFFRYFLDFYILFYIFFFLCYEIFYFFFIFYFIFFFLYICCNMLLWRKKFRFIFLRMKSIVEVLIKVTKVTSDSQNKASALQLINQVLIFKSGLLNSRACALSHRHQTSSSIIVPGPVTGLQLVLAITRNLSIEHQTLNANQVGVVPLLWPCSYRVHQPDSGNKFPFWVKVFGCCNVLKN